MKTILPQLKKFGKQAGQGMVLLFMLLSVQSISAQTNTWDGSSSANWNTASNWSLNQVPTAAHDVVIPNGITATINVNTAAVCKSLTLTNDNTNNTVSITGLNSLSVSGAVSIGAGTGSGDNKVLAVNAGTLTCAYISMSATGNSNRRSELTLTTGTVTVTGGITMNDANNYVRFTSNGQLFIGGNITGGNLVPSTGTVTYNGASAQIITGANTSSFYNLVINKSNAAQTVSSNTHAVNIANNLTVISGELVLNATNANYIIGHDLSIQSLGTLTHNVGWAAFSRSLNVRGDWNHLGGTFNPGTGRVFFDGSSNQLLTGSQSTVFHAVSVNNANHVSLSSVDMIIEGGAGALQFVNGRVITGANKVQLCETCSITGATNARYVDGNLQMSVATGNQVKTFAVGSTSAYAPVTLTLNNVTSAGSILISTPGVEHPGIQSSQIDESRNVNRYWSVQNFGVLFTNANVSFQFQVSDVDAIANSNAFIIAQHNGSWVYPSVSAQTATSINTNGLTEFGDFVVGEGGASAPIMVLQPVNQTACQSAQAVFTSSASGKPGSSVQWQVSTDGGNNFVNIAPGAPYTVNTTQAGNQTNSSLTINPVAIGLDQYDYRAIFNNSRGSVTSDPARLTVTGITVAQAGSNQTICAGLTATMAANTPTLGSGAWSVISGPSTSLAQFSQVNNPQAVFTPAGGAGTYQLRWTITLGACSNFSNVQVTVVNPPSNPNISFNEILQQSSQTIMLCGPVDPGGEHDIDIYNYSVPPGSSFEWQFNTNGGGWTNAGLPSTEDEYPVAAFAGIVGTHQFRLRLTTPAGCVVTSNVLTLNVNPVSSIGGTNQVVCSGANFTANFSGFPLFTMFSWSAPVVTGGITGGSGGLGFSLTDNLVNPTLDPQTATYTVTPIYLLSVSPSCSMSFPVTVTVYPRPTINLSPAAISVCSNTVLQTTQLHYSATTGVPSTYSISWNNTPANTFVPVNNAVLPASPISINVPANTAAGTYTGNLTVRNVNGCVSVSYPFTVTVNARPNIGNSTTALPVCYSDNNQQTTLSYNTLTNSPVSYSLRWNTRPANSFVPVTDAPLNAAPSTIAIQVPGGTAPGTFTGNLTVKNASGCVSVVKTFTLLVRPLPSADWASEAGTVCQNTVAQIVTLPYFSTINSPNTYSIQWNPSPANTFANINNAAFPGSATGGSININVPANTAAGLYTGNITVRNASGCVSPASVFTLTVKGPPVISGEVISGNVEMCENSGQYTFSIPAIANAESYNWSTPAGWQIISGNGTNTVLLSPNTGSLSGNVTVTVSNSCGSAPQVSHPVQVLKSGTWLGVNNNWHDPANWCDGIPTLATNVLIPAGRPNNPIVSQDIASTQNLTIEPGAQVVVQNQTLEIGGNVVSTGGINALAGHIDLKGSSTQSIAGSMFADKTIHELSISHPHGIQFSGANDTVKISYLLSFETSNGQLQTNGNLTLLSRASGTASIGDLTGGGQYSGNSIDGQVTVERYIPNHPKSWQFLSVPTTGQTINQAWQEGNAPMANSQPGYGTIVTGNMPNALSLGFDIATPVASGPGLKTFNSNTGLWEGVAGTHQPILPNQGYMLFVRGDRSVTAFNHAATATILRNTGTLVANGTQALPVHHVDAGKFVAVGNPFASAIDFNTIQKSGGLQDVFYVWDPKLTNSANSPYGLGGYQTFIGPGPNYTVIPGGGSFAGGNTNIESGMAFFVRAEGTTGTLSFAETNKVTGSHLVTRQAARQFPQIRLNLFVNQGSNQVMLDAALSQYDPSFSNTLDIMDARKLANQGSEQISILTGAERLVAERRSVLLPTDTIFYQLSGLRRQSYQFLVQATGLAGTGMMAFLEDSFTGQSTPVSLEGETTVNFTVDQQPGSFAANRFRLVFRPVGPLPVEFSSIRARRLQGKSDARVDWTVGEEIDIEGYQVERSLDGIQFRSVGEVVASPANSGAYTFTDMTAPARVLYYRLRSTGPGGGDLSSVWKLSAIDQSGTFQVYPNPVTGEQIPLYGQGIAVGTYSFGLYNQAGQLIVNGSFKRDESGIKTIISLESKPARGTYYLRIVGPEKQLYQVPLQFQ